MESNNKDIKLKQKQDKLLMNYKNKKIKNKVSNKYINKRILDDKVKNAQSFISLDYVKEDGLITLKNGYYAKVFAIDALDLSLASNIQKRNFFEQLKYLFQIKNLDLRMYKLDDMLDLNSNKDNYLRLIEKYKDDPHKVNFLTEKYEKILELESDKLSTTSMYYFVLVSNNDKLILHQAEDIKIHCYNMTPKLNIKEINNKLEVYQFLINLYMSSADLEQLLWCDLIELIAPFYIRENMSSIRLDDEEIQIVAIKNIPPFVDELFLEELFNTPNTRFCIHMKDSVNTENAIRSIDSNYETLLSERLTTRKLSMATKMDADKENMQELMNQLKNGDEKLKEINVIAVVCGTKEEREEKIKEMKNIAMVNKIKLEIPRLRQYESWQAFDINPMMLEDYDIYMPTVTLAASFPFTISYFNDEKGYMLGRDTHTELPLFFDMFKQTDERISSNLAIIASSGGGKSFTLKKLIVNELARGNRVFIFDAEGEYKKLVDRNNGEYIDLYSTSGGIINPLQVRYLPSDQEERTDKFVERINHSECPLAKHLASLETFIKCAFEDIKEAEVVVLIDMIEHLYRVFGITQKTEISTLEKFSNTDYPTFSDLIAYLPDYKKLITNEEKLKIIDKVEILLDRFNVGIDNMLFNGYTSVNLNNNLIAFNIKDLLYSKNPRITTTQLVNLLSYLNNIVVANQIENEKYTSKEDLHYLSIVVDEMHLYLKNTDSDVMLSFEQLARRIRKYYGNFMPATQSIHDFIGDNESVRSATAIFNNCQYQLVGMLKGDDLNTYLNLFYENPLTETQQDFLLKATKGDFLLTVSNNLRIRTHITAIPNEVELMGDKLS
ncbi:MAG: DUF87 domain-containing protein [bacterium]|nr:DUF87 domain-containing protein [bacterium]